VQRHWNGSQLYVKNETNSDVRAQPTWEDNGGADNAGQNNNQRLPAISSWENVKCLSEFQEMTEVGGAFLGGGGSQFQLLIHSKITHQYVVPEGKETSRSRVLFFHAKSLV
jgi:hypothetical protein